ncbi:DUF4091 domain-containing protein [Pleurocapsales cyanobacterium LEGE 06147]|nr:DUF4091 domain-containing protein [Pleurocapsales cyanobacterium LEGE 06147]
MFRSVSKAIQWLTIFSVSLLLVFVLAGIKNPFSANLKIWVTGSMERIGQEDRPGNVTNIELYAARGEYEPFQIGIQAPRDGLTNVNVYVSDLRGPSDRVISKKNITLYREHYVYVNHSSPNWGGTINHPLGRGWYPDGLIPFINPETREDLTGAQLDAVPFDLDAGKNQPIWVDVFVPRNAQAGEYKGTFTVTSNRGQATGKISLKVWDFDLPLKPSLNSAVELWEQENRNKSPVLELLKHKLMPGSMNLNLNPKQERELIDKWGLSSLRLPFWSGANFQNCSMTPTPSAQEIKAASAKHQTDLLLYVYATDEIDRCTHLYQPLKKWAKNIHQAGVKHLAVMAPVRELYDAVDIWVVNPTRYDDNPEKILEVLQNGDAVWFYTYYSLGGYAPKWLIDYEPINYRIPHGFINQSLGLTGVLYWRADLWTDDPWNNVDYPHEGENYPGEGMLFYPGEQVGIEGIVPSMRLKWIREGVEDYEYIEILKNLGQEDKALKISRSVGADWTNWTRKPEVLESARRQLGEKIEQIVLR